MSLSKQEEIILNKLLAKLDKVQKQKLSERLNLEVKNIINNHYVIEECPYCHSKHIIKKGKNNKNIQRYQCKDCKKFLKKLTIQFYLRQEKI